MSLIYSAKRHGVVCRDVRRHCFAKCNSKNQVDQRVPLKQMKSRVLLISILIVFCLNSSPSADWKYLGPTILGGKTYESFYDDLTRVDNDGIVSVWIKFVTRKQLEKIQKEEFERKDSGKFIDIAAE